MIIRIIKNKYSEIDLEMFEFLYAIKNNFELVNIILTPQNVQKAKCKRKLCEQSEFIEYKIQKYKF